MEEIFRDIQGYEGLYQVSNLGRVKSLLKGKILKQADTTTGYKKVKLCNGNKKDYKIHRLVAYAFIPLVEGKEIINHKDGNPLNNIVNNLEWCTQKENVIHALKTGLKKTIKLTKEELEELYINEKLSLKEIADKKDTTKTTVKRFLKKYNLEIRSMSEADTKYFITKEFLEKELKTKKQIQIAKEIGCEQSLISFYKNKFKI